MAVLSFYPEYLVDGPMPPDPPSDFGDEIYVIRGTHRAYKGSDTPQVAWVRTESGNADLTQYESIEVVVKRGEHKLLTLPATGGTDGRVDFTITSQNVKHRLSLLGAFRLYVVADGRVVYTGLLEVLG